MAEVFTMRNIPIALLGTLVCLSGCATVQAETRLPVYHVSRTDASAAQVARLAAALKIAPESVTTGAGTVSFVDTNRYIAVPHKAAESSSTTGPTGERYEAIDFDALRRITVLSDDAAMKATSNAFSSAGLSMPGSAQPTVGHTTLTAVYRDTNGGQADVTQRIDTRVSYDFMLSDHPLIGPGAQATATFGPDGRATQLHWAGSKLEPGDSVRILPEADVRASLARDLPSDAKVDLKLVYWAPAFGRGAGRAMPTTLIPWWLVSVATQRPGASGRTNTINSKIRLVPATDDAQFVPSAHLSVSAQRAAHVDAWVKVSGGRAPYTVVWGGSDPALASQAGLRVGYTPLTRDAPAGATSVPAREIVSVTVIDANGVTTQASQALDVLAVPITADSSGLVAGPATKGGAGSYGTESPREPDFAVDRVGWQVGMAQPGGGKQRFAWLGSSAWPGDFIEPSPKGKLPAQPWINGDADFSNWGINTAVIVLNNTDGWADGFDSSNPGAVIANYATALLSVPADPPTVIVGMVQGNQVAGTKTANVSYKGAWGPSGPNDHLLWLAMDACDTLDAVDGNGKAPQDRWGPAFGGLHILLGWNSTEQVGDGSFELDFAENMLGVSGSHTQVLQAWFSAASTAGTGHGVAAALGPFGKNGVTNMKDYYPGQGSTGPTILPADITGWWYLTQ
jgi:uncharacterized protein DUF6345